MNLEKMFGMLSGLSGTYRFSNAKLIHEESVLEHLGCVTLTCFILWHEMQVRDPSVTIGLGEVLGKAVVHDVEELLMGDVPRTTKYSSTTSLTTYHQMEDIAMMKIFQSLDIKSRAIVMEHYNAKKGASGLVVKIADALAVVYKVNEEAIERGNRAMLSRTTSITEQLEVCAKEVAACAEMGEAVKTFLGDVLDQAEDVLTEADEMMPVATAIEE
jgi:5'-deoxynucleotidase YfbR-like HD superfamily hydrolase